jgi:hypothetical protein
MTSSTTKEEEEGEGDKHKPRQGNVRECKACNCILPIYAGSLCHDCYYTLIMRVQRAKNDDADYYYDYDYYYDDGGKKEEEYDVDSRRNRRGRGRGREGEEAATTMTAATPAVATYDLTCYEHEKQLLLKEYREFNRIKSEKIAYLAEILELAGYPLHRIATKLLKDLSGDIAKSVILKAIPAKYLTAALKARRRSSATAIADIGEDALRRSRLLQTLTDMKEIVPILHNLADRLIKSSLKYKEKYDLIIAMEEGRVTVTETESVTEILDSMQSTLKQIRAIIDDIRASKDQDTRAYIRELQELCIHLLSLTYSYRHIAKIFGISARWVSKIVRERSIKNLSSVYITLDRDVKKGEQIDILQYALKEYLKILKNNDDNNDSDK